MECSAIGIAPENTAVNANTTRDLSPAAVACAAWFRRLARGLKISRLYRTENSVVIQARETVLDLLSKHLTEAGGWSLRVTPTEILLGEEPVVRQQIKGPREEDVAQSAGEDRLPFIFYRDGIRGIRLPLGIPREELEALYGALRAVGGGPVSDDDLVTMLWQANLSTIQIESVPLEQTIYLSQRQGGGQAGSAQGGEQYSWSPVGAEIHTDLGQSTGAQGLHQDTFDDWDLAETFVDVPEAYAAMLPTMEYSRAHFRAAWEEENSREWTDDAPELLRELLALDPSEETRQAVTHAALTWLSTALKSPDLGRAESVLALLREFDPDLKRGEAELRSILAGLDFGHLAEFLDESDSDDHARFAALTVGLGTPAVDFAVQVMVRATKSRPRAAACIALCYLCADQPGLLEAYVTEARGEVVLQIVFVLGQIGGAEVVDLLRLAAQHPDSRVRRQVVQSLGGVPGPARIPALLDELKSADQQIVVATLGMLAREKNPRVAKTLLEHVSLPDFESRNEELQRAWLSTVAEVAGDESVPALESMLTRGGWLAKRTFLRSAVARTLRRIGSQRAMAALQAGLKARSGAVRTACTEAMNLKGF